MTHNEFAQSLGFVSYEKLVSASEVIVTEGDVYWYVTPLADGRWAAWDDAEIALDRVSYFDTREEAEAFHKDAYAEKYLPMSLENPPPARGEGARRRVLRRP